MADIQNIVFGVE